MDYTQAKDGLEALTILERWTAGTVPIEDKVSLVISDIEMPELDGYTLTRRIRENPALRDLYIILHTSLSGTFNEQHARKVGANLLLPKWHPEELAEAILQRIAAIS